MTADRSTVESWLRRLEKAADEHELGDTHRAYTFREVLAAAWADGHGRGYADSSDDTYRATRDAKTAAKKAAEKEDQ
jgi:hypothetical protein